MRWNSRLRDKEGPHRTAAILLVLSLPGLVLSGCISDEVPDAREGEDADDPEDGYRDEERNLRKDLTQEDELSAPKWKVGDWFGIHLYFGMGDSDGEHFDAIVVDDLGSSWLLATDDEVMANTHAMWDIPLLGQIEKDDLTSTGFGTTWDWMYDFPLKHEKSWSRSLEMTDFETGEVVTTDVEFTATYKGKIDTPDGARPGFQIEGLTPDGDLVAEYDFVPEIGWFAHFYLYQPGSDDWEVHVMSMGHGEGWTGTYYLNEAETVVEHFNGVFPEPPYVEGEPYASFDVGDDADLLSGILVVGAFTGTQQVVLAPPEGDPYHYSVESTEEAAFQEIWLEEEAIGGTWQLASPGVGIFSFHFIMLFQIQVETHELEPVQTEVTED